MQQGAQHHRQTSTGAKCRWNEHYITHHASRLYQEAQECQAPKQGPVAAQYRTSLHELYETGMRVTFSSQILCAKELFLHLPQHMQLSSLWHHELMHEVSHSRCSKLGSHYIQPACTLCPFHSLTSPASSRTRQDEERRFFALLLGIFKK